MINYIFIDFKIGYTSLHCTYSQVELTSMYGLFALQVMLFSLFPLYFLTQEGPLRRVSFYVYISLVLLVGGFFGNVYSLSVAPGIEVSGGSLCYGALMMTSVLFVLVEKDLLILRHLIRLVIVVDVFKVLFSAVAEKSLLSEGIINPHGVSPDLFAVSTPFIILGGILIISELFVLLFAFEQLKRLNLNHFTTTLLYIALFIAVLAADGILFPLIAFGFNADIVAVIVGNLDGKLLTASAFSIPILLFALFKRRQFIHYLESDSFRWNLMFKTSTQLIEEMSEAEHELKQAATVFHNANEGLAIVSANGQLLRANGAFCHMLGIDNAALESISANSLFTSDDNALLPGPHPLDNWRGEVRFGSDTRHQGLLSVTKVHSDLATHATYVYSLVNIDDQKHVQQQLNYLATHDQLTELPNRRVLDQQLAQIEGSEAALIVIDLDHFKDVNDSYGHTAGDQLLKQVVDRLLNSTSHEGTDTCLLHRTGGDEFALLIKGNDMHRVQSVINRIQQQLKAAIAIGHHRSVFISATLGVSFQASGEQRDMFQEADAAMYEAKRNQRGTYAIYEDRLTQQSQRKLRLSTKLKAALEQQKIQVYYQPQYHCQQQLYIGAEALARWHDQELGWISPGEFIPVAEETGLIEQLGEYVLEQACAQGARWLSQGCRLDKLSVNVSAHQLRFGHFIGTLQRVLAATGFPPGQLELELTESAYIERQAEVSGLLTELKSLGVSLAIDDFGTGYSSLSYLSKMPCDTLKIDRSFVTHVTEDHEQANLTSTIIKMAHDLSLQIVVEGVETGEQLQFFRQHGCELIQGYYFSAPVESDKFSPMLSTPAVMS